MENKLVNLNIEGIDFKVKKELEEVYQHFNSKSKINFKFEDEVLLFGKFFSIHFLNNLKYYPANSIITRSNWTKVCSNSFFETSKLFGLVCEFEIENRHDATIRDYDKNVILTAEWEFDTSTIFKENGEIDKLIKSQRKHKGSESLLLTYSIDTNFLPFIDKVYNHWRNSLKKGEDFRLLLLSVLMRKNNIDKVNEVYGMRMFSIDNEYVEIYDDYEI
jgi:hypothetical protein